MTARWAETGRNWDTDRDTVRDHASCLEVGAVIVAALGAIYLAVHVLVWAGMSLIEAIA